MMRTLLLAVFLMSPAAAHGQTDLPGPHGRPAPESFGGSGAGASGQPDGERGSATPNQGERTAGVGGVGGNVTLGTVVYSGLNQPGRISTDTATIQNAWDSAPERAGVAGYRDCGDCVYRIRTRELMVTTVVLPEDRTIGHVDLGDPVGFDIQIRSGNMIAVRPRTIGIDTNMNVYTDRGVMSFYLRAEGFDSGHIPDLVVRIGLSGLQQGSAALPSVGKSAGPETAEGKRGDSASKAFRGLDPAKLRALKGDGASATGFDPAKLRGWGSYRLRGADALRPETVFRDDHFTYVHFGSRWTDLELPVAFVVIDGIDETVNTRIQGRMLVVESTAPLISLKSGEKHLCIEYQGDRT